MNSWAPILTVVGALVALLAAGYAARASMRATRVTEDATRLKWLQEAKSDAVAAKADADLARSAVDAAVTELAEVRRALTAAKREAIELHDLVGELTRWIRRIISRAADDDLPEDELRDIIDGGPASIRKADRDAREEREDRAGVDGRESRTEREEREDRRRDARRDGVDTK